MIACVAATSLAARADEPPALPSLRHLVFTYAAKTAQVVEAFDNGEGRNGVSNGNLGTGPQTGRYVAANDRAGTVTVDVVAVTDDGGIVADVREDGNGAVRTSIASDTAVIHDPRRALTDVSESFLRLLSRRLVPNDAVRGTAWTRERTTPGYTERTRYALAADATPAEATIDVSGSTSTRGARFLDTTERGTVIYDRARSVPKSFTSQARTLETVGTRRRSTDLTIVVRLVSDSFDAR